MRADRSCAAGGLDAEAARRMAEALVRRHAEAPRAPEAMPDAAAYRRALARDLEALAPWAARLGKGILTWLEAEQRRFLETRADCLLARAGDERILARALPLTLADVWLPAAGAARIEPTGRGAEAAAEPDDVAAELAGLSVELRRADRTGPAERLISHYAGEADDFDLYGVIDFHERRCALRRAAACLAPASRAAAGSDAAVGSAFAGRAPERGAAASARGPAAQARPHAEPEAALDAARAYLERVVVPTSRTPRPPLVVAMGGQVASGKSTLARALADRLAAPRVVADRVRDQLLHGAPGGSRHAPARDVHEADWVASFAPGFRARVYAELLRRGEVVLASGRPVVLDACFPRPHERAAARALAVRHGAGFRFVECRVDVATWQQRLAARDAQAQRPGWRHLAERFASEWTPADELAREERHVLATQGPVETSLAALATWLRV